MKDSFLILGATGTIGGRVLDILAGEGRAVTGASRSRTGRGWAALDITDPSTFHAALDGISVVMLMARPGDEEAHVYAEPLIEEMVRRGVRKVVFLSALGAGSRPKFSIRKVEKLVESSGLDWTFVRPNFFMQMLATPPISAEIARHGTLSLPLAGSRTAYVDADDVAAVLARALTDPALDRKAVDVNGPQALDHYEVAERISAAAGRPITYVPLTEEAARALLSSRFPRPQTERLLRFYALVREGRCAEPDRSVAGLLGRPLIRFSDFASANSAAWRA